MSENHCTVVARDGIKLAATSFEPEHPPKAAVLINGATGVKRQFYFRFARHLASRGLAVMTYDYRGIGESADKSIPKSAMSMRAWGQFDCDALISYLTSNYSDLPVAVVGHSVGGQLLGLLPNNDRVSAAACVASQSGYWRHWPLKFQPMLASIWYLAVPIALAMTGVLPRQFAGAELPGGVAREWARWCTNPDFIVDEAGQPIRHGFDSYRGALKMIQISDDNMYAPPKAVDALASYFTATTVQRQTLNPAQLGLTKLGHFGFFLKKTPVQAWDEIADWLLAACVTTHQEAA